MNFVTFIENRFQEVKLEMDSSTTYDIKSDAETKSLHQLLNGYRIILKWTYMPKIIWHFLMVKLNKRPEPKAVLVEKIKAQKEAEDLKKKENLPNNVKTIKAEVVPNA